MARYAYLARRGRFPEGSTDVSVGILILLGLQQCLNYLLFRVDQIFLSLAQNIPVMDSEPPLTLADYLLHSKIYEAACAVTMLACMVSQPRTKLSTMGFQLKPNPQFLGGLEVCLMLTSLGALLLGWFERSGSILLPFAIAAALSLPVNRRTLQALRNDGIGQLIMALSVSLAVGFLGAVFLPRPIELSRLAYIVPVQMLAFLCMFGSTKRGRAIRALR
jgi:hypothetical protein